MRVECPHKDCNRRFERLGRHWNSNPSHRPSLTEEQHEVTTGVLMGDGYLSHSLETPRLTVTMIKIRYLQYLDDIFGVLSTGPRIETTSGEAARRAKRRGFSENAKSRNYSDQYVLRIRRHPDFKKYEEWYETGEKVWPEDIVLTPKVLKHWYCGDGSYQNNDSWTSGRITIALANERGNREKIEEMFRRVGLPTPSYWDVRKRDSGRWDVNIYWTQKGSRMLFQYMGSPIPGFEYKWPSKNVYSTKVKA